MWPDSKYKIQIFDSSGSETVLKLEFWRVLSQWGRWNLIPLSECSDYLMKTWRYVKREVWMSLFQGWKFRVYVFSLWYLMILKCLPGEEEELFNFPFQSWECCICFWLTFNCDKWHIFKTCETYTYCSKSWNIRDGSKMH